MLFWHNQTFKALKADSEVLEMIRERLKIDIIESVFDEDQYDVPTFLRKSGDAGVAP